MSKEIKTEILIKSDPKRVWQVLTDFKSYPNWNPFIKSIRGEKIVGNKLATEILPPNRRIMKFTPVLLEVDSERELRWLGSGPVRGIFDGEHYFKIIPQENGSVKFIQGEKFSGILVRFMPKLLADTKHGFEQMNEALRKECENQN
ncbi:MAG: hypothetical protein ACI9SD_001640 [Pseudohongiellaceae bacterium]|jgi:hypothetical protein